MSEAQSGASTHPSRATSASELRKAGFKAHRQKMREQQEEGADFDDIPLGGHAMTAAEQMERAQLRGLAPWQRPGTLPLAREKSGETPAQATGAGDDETHDV